MKEIEWEKPKETEQSCGFCGPGFPATWQIITKDGEGFVCDDHHSLLNAIKTIQKERLLFEAEWSINAHYEDELMEHEFDGFDDWEDGSLFGF